MNRLIPVAILALAASSGAHAVPVQVDFQVTGFGVAAGPVVPVPQSTVTGSITYDAPSTTSPITSLTGVSLTIDGYTYALGDLNFDPAPTTTQGIGAFTGGPNNVGTGPDFFITWDKATLAPGSFFYSVSSGITVFSGTISQFSVTAVPEPASLLLMALGVAAVGVQARRRRSA